MQMAQVVYDIQLIHKEIAGRRGGADERVRNIWCVDELEISNSSVDKSVTRTTCRRC